MTDLSLDRRECLAVFAGLGAVGIAGCTDNGAAPGTTDGSDDGDTQDTDGPDGNGYDGTGTSREDASTATSSGAQTGTDGDLDLREANVTGVLVEPSGDGYRFDVTLYHDDDGEDGYANWWQAEDLDGERLGRRDLMHAHSTEPFTRSETVDIPDDVACVVVRGHDQTHEYGGQAMAVDVESGETNPVRQGPERQSVSEDDCPG